jgi:hypothetical protein
MCRVGGSDDNREDMPDLSVRELKTEMYGRFADVDRRFGQLETRITEAAVETRRHFDVIAESLRAEMRLRLEGTDTRVDDHERRIHALEKRRR